MVKSKENLPADLVGFIAHALGVSTNMKWDKPPLWPVVLPPLSGFSVALLEVYLELPVLLGWGLLMPVVIIAMSSISLLLLPERFGSRLECVIGFVFMVAVAVLPQLVFPVWFIIVIIFWMSQSLYIWRRNYPNFRLGIWLGAGSMSGLYLGSLAVFNLMS